MTTMDLTTAEQTHVRTALRFLRSRCGTWANVGKVLGVKPVTLGHIVGGTAVTPTLAFRVARFVKVSVDDVLAGRFPAPGTCPHCGHLGDSRP
jgi:plasmid maintenance system antidote protein VapI